MCFAKIKVLKGSYDVAKKNIIFVFGVMQCVYVVRGSKNTLFPHTVHYCSSSMLRLSETR